MTDLEEGPDDPWNGRALRVSNELGWEFGRAYDCVIYEYLQAGDSRPLIDAILRHRVPGPGILRYLAAMFDREVRKRLAIDFEFPFEILIEQINPRRGRPPTQIASDGPSIIAPSTYSDGERATYCLMAEAIRSMAKGLDPGRKAWECFAWLLDPHTCRTLFPHARPFFWKSKFSRVDGRRGRPRNPELAERDFLIGGRVDQLVLEHGPGSYEAAVATVAAETPSVGLQTIRDAYDMMAARAKNAASAAKEKVAI